MGRSDLLDTPLSANQKERYQHKDEIDAIVSEWTKTRSVAEITKLLKEADVPCAKVPAFDEVCNDPQLLSRGMITEVEQALSGKVKVPGSIYKLSKTPGDPHSPAPFLGEYNQEIYADLLGYSEQEIEKLSNDGII